MTTDNYINQNQTSTFKKGDSVVMHTCMEASMDKYMDKVWECRQRFHVGVFGNENIESKMLATLKRKGFLGEYVFYVANETIVPSFRMLGEIMPQRKEENTYKD